MLLEMLGSGQSGVAQVKPPKKLLSRRGGCPTLVFVMVKSIIVSHLLGRVLVIKWLPIFGNVR